MAKRDAEQGVEWVPTIAAPGFNPGRIAVTAWMGGRRSVRIGDSWALLTSEEAEALSKALVRPIYTDH